jgi:hypothetical protein
VLDIFDRDRRVVDAERAGTFAGRGTNASGELWEVVRLVQTIKRYVPKTTENEVIPLGDEIMDRAASGHAANQFARVAKRYAAIHTPRALGTQFLFLHVVVELVPVTHAFKRRTVDRNFAQVLDESGWFAHLGMI